VLFFCLLYAVFKFVCIFRDETLNFPDFSPKVGRALSLFRYNPPPIILTPADLGFIFFFSSRRVGYGSFSLVRPSNGVVPYSSRLPP